MKIDVCDKCGRSFLRSIGVVTTYKFMEIKDIVHVEECLKNKNRGFYENN
jgi:hypothetical protein